MMSEIYIIDVQTRALVNVTAGNSRDNNRLSHQSPAWLADRERISLVRNDDCAIIRTDITELTKRIGQENVRSGELAVTTVSVSR
jgi:hypothetical protein